MLQQTVKVMLKCLQNIHQ